MGLILIVGDSVGIMREEEEKDWLRGFIGRKGEIREGIQFIQVLFGENQYFIIYYRNNCKINLLFVYQRIIFVLVIIYINSLI